MIINHKDKGMVNAYEVMPTLSVKGTYEALDLLLSYGGQVDEDRKILAT